VTDGLILYYYLFPQRCEWSSGSLRLQGLQLLIRLLILRFQFSLN